MWSKTKDFIKQNESKIILSFGFILVAVLSFEAGIMKGNNTKQNQVIVNSTSDTVVCGTNTEESKNASNLAQEALKNTESNNIPAQNISANCAYIGSKNSNKFHLPTCRWAKQIKPENRVCFSDANEAQSKGYQADKNCIK